LVTLATEVVGKPSTVAAFGTDASELSRIAPCIILGPGTIDDAHQPDERISISALEDGVATFSSMLRGFDALSSA
jgi:acetylornithine deacetylase/succinyl-diaminopimelate desuccinylase-like protein